VPAIQVDCSVKLGTKEITGDEVHDVLVEADLDQPDHTVVTLSNLSTRYSEDVTEGDELVVKLGFVDGKNQGTVFKGEVVGIEPIYAANAPARVHIRGYNQLHRLMRGKKSVTYTKVTDKDIVDKLGEDPGATSGGLGSMRVINLDKGSAATLGLEELSDLAHKMEDAVLPLRGSGATIPPPVADLSLIHI